ncbi:hypothetical protein ABZX77_15350 [Streptomyces sp. NPDC004237]|uniref:hypothetical protein n=1 Tax=Streptomyces sp. NPDC004237 TaxID=3154455 RepID=UPI0033AFE44E
MPPAAYDLEAVCDVCLQPVRDGEGALAVDTARAERLVHAWRKRVGADPLAVFPHTSGHHCAAWTVRHHTCGRQPRFCYAISVERIRTWTGLLHWSAHLADKHWLVATDWNALVLRALEPRRAAVSGLLPVRPRDLRGGPVGDLPNSTDR